MDSYLKLLPDELFDEIVDKIHLKDVIALYKSLDSKPSDQQLRRLAEVYELPYATSLSVLRYHNKGSYNEQIKYCIKYKDVDSFSRLYKGNDHIAYPHLCKYKSREIAEIYFSQPVEVNIGNFELALEYDIIDAAKRMIGKVNFERYHLRFISEATLKELFPLIPYNYIDIVLSVALSNEWYDIAQMAIDKGASLNDNVNLEFVPEVILKQLGDSVAVKQELVRRAFLKDNLEEVLPLIESFGIKYFTDEMIVAFYKNNQMTKEGAYELIALKYTNNKKKVADLISQLN